jgi:hypothetical protein
VRNGNERVLSVAADCRAAAALIESGTKGDSAAARCLSRLIGMAGAQANKAAAIARAEEMRPVFMRTARLSAYKAADELNARGFATPTGHRWWPQTVIRVRRRLGLS